MKLYYKTAITEPMDNHTFNYTMEGHLITWKDLKQGRYTDKLNPFQKFMLRRFLNRKKCGCFLCKIFK